MSSNTETRFVIFTDGSSRGNPGPGGWGAILVDRENMHITESGGGDRLTTNNRMELTAVIEALSQIPSQSSVVVHTDSSYVINGITKWVSGWKKNGWKTKAKGEVLNKDLWLKLDVCVETREVIWKYVGGHVGILGNERCDHIATAYADERNVKLYTGTLAQYDLPDVLTISHDVNTFEKKQASSSRSRSKAYSYVSMVDGVIEVHHSWTECEKRVKGSKGARYKKTLDREDEEYIIKEFGSF